MAQNYYKIKSFPLFRQKFLYVDADTHLADQVFIRHQLPVRFKGDFQKPGSPYQMIACSVERKRIHDFLECMQELERNMILTGHTDYPEFCEEMMGLIVAYQKEKEGEIDECTVNDTGIPCGTGLEKAPATVE